MKLHTENVPGNLHEAATWINKQGWAEYVVVMHYVNSSTTVAVFKMPNAMVYKIRANKPGYIPDPHHDDDEPCEVVLDPNCSCSYPLDAETRVLSPSCPVHGEEG